MIRQWKLLQVFSVRFNFPQITKHADTINAKCGFYNVTADVVKFKVAARRLIFLYQAENYQYQFCPTLVLEIHLPEIIHFPRGHNAQD